MTLLRVARRLPALTDALAEPVPGGAGTGALHAGVLEDALLEAEARRRLLTEPTCTAAEVAGALGRSGTSNDRQVASDLRKAGDLIGLPRGRAFAYPAFQGDRRRRRVHPVVAEVNRLLDARSDPWGVASWWLGGDGRLGGRAPVDLVGTAEEPRLVAMARGDLDAGG